MVPKLTSFVALSALCVGSTVANVQYGGINIAGFDFGIDTTGSGSASQAYPPLKAISGIDGVGQMQHFVTDDKFNAFRLPVGWQYLVNDQVGPIDPSNLATYDQLVQGCLQTGALCIIDIHNYARFNGGIIGQGGPSNEQFADFWGSLATKYASQDQVAFGLMNEPHDLNVDEWTQSVQAAVTAIRGAGANNNMVLMPSTSYTSAATLVSSGCAASLNGVTNPDGSKTNLVFDVHRYFDGDGSGTSTDCVSANIADFQSVADFMHANNRQAFVTEIGGGSTPSCIPIVSQVIDFLK
ncbi:MAG: hypothetical protein M1838_000896 [Thelocarpon superellum]|nr:MAG: hypothetical protein M1838_000896 [Thelocarpon superellum]